LELIADQAEGDGGRDPNKRCRTERVRMQTKLAEPRRTVAHCRLNKSGTTLGGREGRERRGRERRGREEKKRRNGVAEPKCWALKPIDSVATN